MQYDEKEKNICLNTYKFFELVFCKKTKRQKALNEKQRSTLGF
jgi:hypothetical protein